jgi:hypothetical protein
MKTVHDDSLTKALALLRRTVPGEDRALTDSPLSPVSGDIGELFLVELQARRERLKHWIHLLHEEAGLSAGRAPVVQGSRHKCRGLHLPPRVERRLGGRRHSTAA